MDKKLDLLTINQIKRDLKIEKNLVHSKETDSKAEYIYEDDSWYYYSYDDPYSSVEKLKRKEDNKIIFQRYNSEVTIERV